MLEDNIMSIYFLEEWYKYGINFDIRKVIFRALQLNIVAVDVFYYMHKIIILKGGYKISDITILPD